jgi:hypothetical protein
MPLIAGAPARVQREGHEHLRELAHSDMLLQRVKAIFAKPLSSHSGVYFIASQYEYIKIGYARNLRHRLTELPSRRSAYSNFAIPDSRLSRSRGCILQIFL